MLKSLFPTKQQRKIWGILFSHPEKVFYLRELARLSELNPTQVSRELELMRKDGVVEIKYDGNRKYVNLREDFPLFSEFKTIVKKTLGIEAILKKFVKGFKGIELAFIYGSVARDEEREGSDIDLFLMGKLDLDEFDRKLWKLEDSLGREINYTLFSKREFEAKKGKEPFLKDLLRGEKIVLIDNEASA